MMPCPACTPLDEQGKPELDEHGNFCLSDAEGKPFSGIKQVGKTKYDPNGIDYVRQYRCLDCDARWKMVGKLDRKSSYEPLIRIDD